MPTGDRIYERYGGGVFKFDFQEEKKDGIVPRTAIPRTRSSANDEKTEKKSMGKCWRKKHYL